MFVMIGEMVKQLCEHSEGVSYNMTAKRYRINEELLHKENLGKNALTDIIVNKHSATTGWASTYYHYTSPEGLIGILKSRHIYFTDCQFLNDYKERLEINDELENFWTQNKKYYDKEFYILLWQIRISEYENADFYYFEREKNEVPCRYFIMSTSRNGDSLNMWKYYAKNGTYNGYNFGMFTPALADEWIDQETGVAIEEGDVLYFSNEKQEKIRNTVEILYDVWCKYKRSKELDLKISGDFKVWLSHASIFFKNECFASEEEYRFVAIAPESKLNSLFYTDGSQNIKMYDFRIVNGVAIPYLKMPICFYNTEDCMTINNIRIGPSLNAAQMVNGIIQFIKSLDYKIDKINIEKSNIPLRY